MSNGLPKRVKLKNGRVVTLRALEKSDEAALGRFFAGLPPEATEFLRDDVRDPGVIRHFIEERDPDRVFCILAVTEDGQVVADATLHKDPRGWRRHLGEIRVVVAPEVQKLRLASAMIRELVTHATFVGLKKVVAQILDSQAEVGAAFQRLGFCQEARLVGHALDMHGQQHDILVLTNDVDALWDRMQDLLTDLDTRGSAQ
ncbi:MAG: GNAT family N-acetyltransferase [Deltaproteobacteria bacterium]|nr:GNAT family N-acetyltransferase [Deltaproteobacteria bacterium]